MKYKIKFPARCTHHYHQYRGGHVHRWQHCANVYGHTGTHEWPPKKSGWKN